MFFITLRNHILKQLSHKLIAFSHDITKFCLCASNACKLATLTDCLREEMKGLQLNSENTNDEAVGITHGSS